MFPRRGGAGPEQDNAMIPLFFGDTEQPLFGVYHPPAGASGSHGVLIAGPVGHEYYRVHRMCRNLAVGLSRVGIPTLRFDFTGNGDSSGEAQDGDLEVWRRDLVTAAEELCDTSGCQEISVLGIRFGATVAASVERFPCSVETLILWDPVVNGETYLAELMGQHQTWLGDSGTNGSPRELLGSAISPKFLAELRVVDLGGIQNRGYEKVLLAISEPRPEFELVSDRLREIGVPFDTSLTADEYDWHDPRRVETLVTAPNMTRELVDRIGGG